MLHITVKVCCVVLPRGMGLPLASRGWMKEPLKLVLVSQPVVDAGDTVELGEVFVEVGSTAVEWFISL